MPISKGAGGGSGGGGSGTVTNVSSADTSIAVATPTTTPVLTVASLATIAANHASAGAITASSQKITNLAVASASTDAASLANSLDQFTAPAANVSMNSHKLTSLTSGAAATDAAAWGQLPHIVDSATRTTNLSVTATTEGAAQTILTGSGFTADGTTQYLVEFFAGTVIIGTTSGSNCTLVLLDGASVVIGKWCVLGNNSTAGPFGPIFLRYLVTPSAASHTYSVAAFRNASNATVDAGSGGSAADPPALLTVTQLRN